MKKIPLILDIDTGIDDAVALVFAEKLKNLDLQLITTVHGNVDLEKVNHNTLVICEDVNSDVKIVSGEKDPINITDFYVSAHGKNGLGNYTHKVSKKISDENYIDAIHETVIKNRLTNIVACGPLTNLAKYILTHPEDNDKIRLIIVTGMLEVDKKNPYLNFNLAKDIKACEIVLNQYKNIVFVPSDMGHISYIKSEDFYKSADCGRIGKILANMYPYHLDRTVKNGAAMHDLCGVLWLSKPSLFKTASAFVKLKKLAKGSFLEFNFESIKPNTSVTTDVNIKKMHKLYYKTLKSIK